MLLTTTAAAVSSSKEMEEGGRAKQRLLSLERARRAMGEAR